MNKRFLENPHIKNQASMVYFALTSCFHSVDKQLAYFVVTDRHTDTTPIILTAHVRQRLIIPVCMTLCDITKQGIIIIVYDCNYAEYPDCFFFTSSK